MAPLPEFLERLFTSKRNSLSDGSTLSSSATLWADHHGRSLKTISRRALDAISSHIKNRSANASTNILAARAAASTPNPGQGTTSPESFNNAGMLALFAILGAGMVGASLWFFFWAKNGGFQWRENDWEDYKSTVLRRKGPDGKTLSNATKSTKLGGGTIAGSQHYKWQQSLARSVVGYDEKGRKGIRAVRGWGKTHSITYNDDLLTRGTRTVTDMTEVRTEYDPGEGHPVEGEHSTRYRDRDVQEYKREKPARVGGMNRVADGSHYDYSQSGSDLMSDTMTQLTESSDRPMLQKSSKETSKKDKQRQAEKEKERAERKAREQAAKMERRWKREAEQAAASMATYSEIDTHDDIRPPPSVATHTTRKSAAPSLRPANRKLRRETSPRKPAPPPSEMTSSSRDFSYTTGEASEILSTIYSEGTGTRAPSYYDEYRPRGTEHHPRYPSEQHTAPPPQSHAGGSRSRQSSPRKKPSSSNRYQGAGYRRGGMDSDLE